MILHIHKKRWEHVRFYSLLCVLAVLLFVRYGLERDIPRIILTGTIAVIALLGNRNEILAIAMCCIPLHEAVDFFYAVVACAGVYILKYHRDIQIGVGVILTLIMIIWELLHCFTADFSVKGFLVSVIPLIFLAVVLCIDASRIDYAFIVRTMAVMVAITSMVMLSNAVVKANFDFAAAVEGLRRLGFVSDNSDNDAMQGGALNPNSLGVICVLASTGLLQLRTAGRNHRMDIPLLVILLVFGTLSSSRTFVFCLLVMVVLMIIAQPGSIRKKVRLSAMLTLTAAVALLLLRVLFPDLLEYYANRFRTGNIARSRDILMVSYHRFISDNPSVWLFGIGLQDYGIRLIEVFRIARFVPHNSIQEIIIAWGIPGLLMFILMCFVLYWHAGKYQNKIKLLNQIPILIIIVKSMAGQLLTSGYTMLAMVYAYLSLCQEFRPIEERNRSFILQSPQTLASYDTRDDLLNNKIERGG